jgi:hypothetical protein
VELVVAALIGLLVYREVSSYMERKRLTGMLYAKSMDVYAPPDQPVKTKARKNLIAEQHKAQKGE